MTMDLFSTTWRDYWGGAESAEPVGAIFTRIEVVRLILDLADYIPTRRLRDFRLLEPSCGDGAFLREIVSRLALSEKTHGTRIDWHDKRFEDAIRAADINAASVEAARRITEGLLTLNGCDVVRAKQLASTWILHTDFLLHNWQSKYDFVVGNPPYVRIEDLPKSVLTRYRELYESTSDRADIYVAFIQRGLETLSPSGVLSYICANRFSKNKYGASLRRIIANNYRVRSFINLEHTQPFHSEVSAYPAILVVDRQLGEPTHAATLDDISPKTLETVHLEATRQKGAFTLVAQFPEWYPNGEPWTSTSVEEHAFLSRLQDFPRLEESAADTKVGIGVATGADRVFVLTKTCDAVEASRLLPLILARDISNNSLSWSGHQLINPYRDEDDGQLVDLKEYPRLAAYLQTHLVSLRNRHVARSRPESWYRTIDRIWPRLLRTPKLLIPDIQVGCTIGYDEGAFYPHHNLYWVTSASWPLEALKALLRSNLVTQQVRAYSVQMRGGSVRYQAQTLRQIRIPRLSSLNDGLLLNLAENANSSDTELLDELAAEAFAFGSAAKG
jgi:hypothetical protein